jgi:hypothetical protein
LGTDFRIESMVKVFVGLELWILRIATIVETMPPVWSLDHLSVSFK